MHAVQNELVFSNGWLPISNEGWSYSPFLCTFNQHNNRHKITVNTFGPTRLKHQCDTMTQKLKVSRV